MHPILKSRQRITLYLLCWLPIAALLTAILRRGAASWTEALVIALPMCAVYAFMCLSAWYVCQALPLRGPGLAQLMGALAGASSLSSAVWFGLGDVWVLAIEPWTSLEGIGGRYMAQFLPIFVNGALLFLLAAAAHYLLIAFDESRAAEKRALEMQVLAREAELRALRAQIDPHFLFNSLNSISALTMTDAGGARRMCLLLADFLRTSLVLGAKPQIPIADELKLVSSFLDIEKVRYGARLTVERNVGPECSGCLVPPLLIQPLVENAIRHGIAPLVDGGTLRIDIRRRSSTIEIAIENPIDSSESKRTDGAGVGLANVRSRLARAFSDRARMDVARSDGRFRVLLQIPCTETGDTT